MQHSPSQRGDWPHKSGAHFPVPRLSEGFFDDAVERSGGKRVSSVWRPSNGVRNADYVFPRVIAELKLLEEEGMAKETRQNKLAKLLEGNEPPAVVQKQIDDILMEPIQGAVRKAARQLADTKNLGPFEDHQTVLIAANSGYSSLPPELFEHLVLRSCEKDTSQIDFLICVSVHYHQGDFDAFVFCKPKAIPVKEHVAWAEADTFLSAVLEKFNEAMTSMMRDQMNPALWENHLPPVRDIVFERNGVTYVQRAPSVPDSRYTNL